jgi:hypothetical protein
LSCIIHALAGQRPPLLGREAAPLARCSPPTTPKYTWTCVLCRCHHLSCPFFRFVWFLGWSTWHLALDPSSLLHLQHKPSSYLDALRHLPPPQPVPRQLLPLRHIQLTQPRFYTSRLLAFHSLLPLRPPQLRPT